MTSHAALSRMEHGFLGEARTRAFLAERFWILERSVDIEGADFLVQRRLTDLRDQDAPRLGFVQAKFIQDEGTTIYIAESYVRDRLGPRDEFFLIVHSGLGDHAVQALLPARDIASDFAVAPDGHSHSGKFVLPGKRILQPKYRVRSVARALDEIGHRLRLVDLTRNRAFVLGSTPFYVQLTPDAIDPAFLVPLDNDWGDIQRQFFAMKQRAQRTLYEVEDFEKQLQTIISTTDPLEALGVAEELDIDARGSNHYVSFRADFWSEDFFRTVREHRERHDRLRDAGLLDAFLALPKQIEDYLVADLSRMTKPSAADAVYVLSMTYEPTTLAVTRFASRIGTRPHPEKNRLWIERNGVMESAPGALEVWWAVFDHWSTFEDDLQGQLRQHAWQLRRVAVEEVWRHVAQ